MRLAFGGVEHTGPPQSWSNHEALATFAGAAFFSKTVSSGSLASIDPAIATYICSRYGVACAVRYSSFFELGSDHVLSDSFVAGQQHAFEPPCGVVAHPRAP